MEMILFSSSLDLTIKDAGMSFEKRELDSHFLTVGLRAGVQSCFHSRPFSNVSGLVPQKQL